MAVRRHAKRTGMLMRVVRVVSGGQTGADRAALDVAISRGIKRGGWVPKGRVAEDGVIPHNYCMEETPSTDVQQRTEWNVRDSDASLIVSSLPLRGGTALTEKMANKYNKPVFIFCIDNWRATDTIVQLKKWLEAVGGGNLNVAGPRAPEEPSIYNITYEIMNKLFDNNPI